MLLIFSKFYLGLAKSLFRSAYACALQSLVSIYFLLLFRSEVSLLAPFCVLESIKVELPQFGIIYVQSFVFQLELRDVALHVDSLHKVRHLKVR